MTHPLVALAPHEMDWARALVLGDESGERRLLALVRDGRVVQALRTDLAEAARAGPLRDAAALYVDAGARALRALPQAVGVERVVALEAQRIEAEPSLLEAVLHGAAPADPPWLPALESLERLARRLRTPLSRILPDGGYLLAAPGSSESEAEVPPPAALLMRVRGARIEELHGAEALTEPRPEGDGSHGSAARSWDAASLAARARLHVAPLHLAIVGPRDALRALVQSRRPASTLERARIRDTLDVHLSSRFALTLVMLRLLGR